MSYERALAAFQVRRWDLAKQHLAEELAARPDYASAHAMLGACCYNSGEMPAAVEHAKDAIKCDPRLAYAHYILALAYSGSRCLYEAEIAIEEALTLDPLNADYLVVLAGLQPLNSKKGMELTDAALSRNPNHSGALHQKYDRLKAAGRKTEADAVRAHALSVNPLDAHMHGQSGWQALSDPDGHERAVEHFREALRLNPGADRLIDGLTEAEYRNRSVLGRLLNRMSWRVLVIILGVGWVGALLYSCTVESVFHAKIQDEVMIVGLGGPLALMAVVLILQGVSKGIFYFSLLLSKKDKQLLAAKLEPRFAGKWWGFLLGLVLGGMLIFFDVQLKTGALKVVAPHWLYSDWTELLPHGWTWTAPAMFALSIIFAVCCIASLTMQTVKRQPRSTRYFSEISLLLWCVTIWLLFAAVAVFRPGPWFVVVLLVVVYGLAFVRRIPFLRERVKEAIRKGTL